MAGNARSAPSIWIRLQQRVVVPASVQHRVARGASLLKGNTMLHVFENRVEQPIKKLLPPLPRRPRAKAGQPHSCKLAALPL
jgi:hypothetical protein